MQKIGEKLCECVREIEIEKRERELNLRKGKRGSSTAVVKVGELRRSVVAIELLSFSNEPSAVLPPI